MIGSGKLKNRLNHRQLALLTHALKHPGELYKIEGHQRSHAVVYQTARSDLLGLVELGLLNKQKTKKVFLFQVPVNLRETIAQLAG